MKTMIMDGEYFKRLAEENAAKIGSPAPWAPPLESGLFIPRLINVSCTGNFIYSRDPAVVAAEKAAQEIESQRHADLIASARAKLTQEEYDAVVSEGYEY